MEPPARPSPPARALEVFADPGAAPPAARGAAVALGNFDGVHRGHQAVIAAALSAARARGLAPAAAVFEPHPRQVFRPDLPPFRLQSPGQRARALAFLGVERIFQIRFDEALAMLSDGEFARVHLQERIGAAHVVVGGDFLFGRARMGDVDALVRHGAALGFTVGVAAPVTGAGGGKVSSSDIRAAIAGGRVGEAERLLTRPWAIEGMVGPGAARGRTIGFPTANLGLGAYVEPRFGVYAVEVDAGDGVWRPGVANCGVKPTVGGSAPLLETHIFDFTGDLYGRRLEVALRAFLRPERKFESVEALQDQIARDAQAARIALAQIPPGSI